MLKHSFMCKLEAFLFLLFTVTAATKEKSPESVDFIVVGGGVGGSVVANRLSENGRYTVALVEAGGLPDPLFDIPVMAPILMTQSHPSVRVYDTVPQENAALADGGNARHAAGIVMGGGSAVNAMVFNRGSPHDYDNWANITGDNSWSYANLLEYFKKSETYVGIYPSDQRGTTGPITVSIMELAAGEKVFLDAGEALGYSVGDSNGPQTVGFSRVDMSKKFGRRVSSYHGYIQPIMGSRRNLRVIMHTTVSNIIFQGNRAVGVNMVTNINGKLAPRVLMASKEVILCAGVFETPAILQRSGIGPKDVLNRAQIQIRKELPVGHNLQNHLNMLFDMVINDTTQVFIRDRDLNPENYHLWQTTGEGPYSTFYGHAGQAFLESSAVNSSLPGGWADIHLYALNSPEIPGLYPLRTDITLNPGEVVTTAVIQYARPLSRGTVAINASNIHGNPVVDFQYLTHPQDMEGMLDGVKKTLELYENTAPYQRIGAHVPQPPMEACAQFTFRSDAYWKCVIGQRAVSGRHAAGTCKMGRSSDPSVVVTTKLRVIGFDGLRVVDASIIPNVINANFVAGLYGIAEKASEMILQDWNLKWKGYWGRGQRGWGRSTL